MGKIKMTTEEAFIKVLQMHGIDNAFGIIGSALMPVTDLFPAAGITFWDCGHENSGGMMADGFTRASGKMSMLVGQNGPGIANFVTPVKVAYWNHTPLLVITAQAANMTLGQGGFQEVPQMAMFEDMVAYQEEVRHPARMAEVLNRVILQAKRASAPAQINIPRDFWTQVVEIELPRIIEFERPAGGEQAIAQAAELLSNAKFPVILNGGGVVLGDAIDASKALAEKLDAPVCCNYQHNDAFPGSHPLFAGPLGYNGSKAGMEVIAKADVVLALGTRLNPFSTLPSYGIIDYWPHDAKIIQVDMNADRIGLTKPVSVGIVGDAKKVANAILEQLSDTAGDMGRDERQATLAQAKSDWEKELATMDHELDDEGTTWNERCQKAEPEKMTARMAWRSIIKALPKEAIISSDIGNNCAIGNAYPTFEEGRKYLGPGMFGSTLLLIALLINYLVTAQSLLLGLYSIPTLFSAYFYGRRHATLTAFASVFLIGLITYFNDSLFNESQAYLSIEGRWYDIIAWGGILVLTAYAMGTLYERNDKKVRELRQTYYGLLHILRHFISNDKYTENHSYRVSIYAAKIAAQLGFNHEQIEDVRGASLLHDIGKLEISRNLLHKAAHLTQEEYSEIKKHVEKGVDVLEPVGGPLNRIIPIILAHHDKYDGSGYHASSGKEIPLEARIIAVADVYDSLISDRPYRKAMSPFDAKEIIIKGSGTEFDPEVVEAFLTLFMKSQMDVPSMVL